MTAFTLPSAFASPSIAGWNIGPWIRVVDQRVQRTQCMNDSAGDQVWVSVMPASKHLHNPFYPLVWWGPRRQTGSFALLTGEAPCDLRLHRLYHRLLSRSDSIHQE